MVHLTCDCLNIRIHAKTLVEDDPKLLKPEISDPFFQEKVSKVTLDLAGITKEMPCLVKTRSVSFYNIFSCVNCKKDVYASSTQGEENIFASKKLKSDPNELVALMQLENYSPLYKIIIQRKPSSPQAKKPLSLDLHTRRSESVEKTLNSLQLQLTRFLQSEQEALDERIRSYIEEQKAAYASLQSRVRQDKQAVASLVLESEENDLENSLSDAMIDTTPGLTPPLTPVSYNQLISNSTSNDGQDQLSSEEQDKVVGEITKPPLVRQRPQSFNRPLHGKIRRKGVYTQPRVAQSLDIDGIFDLEGVEEELSPFYRSEDELESGGDEMSNDDVFSTTPYKDVIRNGQMSLPVNMPKFTRHSHVETESDEDEEKTRIPDDPAQIVASIKAMSRSIHQSDTTEMFGDLPRPRLNTMN